MNSEPSKSETSTLSAPDVAALLVKARAVFAENEQEHGTPEAPTQAGFLALARAGKEVWSAWRKAYPEPIPDFIGVDFRGDAAIDFSGFSFTGGGRGKEEEIIYCVYFDACMFGDGISFHGAQFGDMASFDGAQFGDMASFYDAQFGDMASFTAWDASKIQNFWKKMSEKVAQQRENFVEARGLRSNAFHRIIFLSTQFHGSVNFQGRTFLSETYFSLVSFKGIPSFHGCTLHQDTSFDCAEFSAPPSAEAARAYRTLKLAFAQQHAIREEQRFFKLEMQAETGITKYPKRLLYQLYRHISDYGFSLIRPVGLWFAGLVLATFAYGYLAGASLAVTNIDWPLTLKLIKYSLLNAMPLPGLDKMSGDLFLKDSGIQLALTVLEILHKTVSLVAFFLIGLALRNLFKMKG